MTLTLYLSDKPSQLNKDIITYLNANLGSIVKMKLYINFVVAKAQDVQAYTQRGIVNFPTLAYQKNKYVGVDSIKTFFNNHHKKYKDRQAKRTEKDDVSDYWTSILSKGDDEDDMVDEADKMKARAMKAVQDRQSKLKSRDPTKVNRPPARSTTILPPSVSGGSKRKANLEPSPMEALGQMRSTGQEAIDDDLMAKFFENQVETTF